MCGRIYRYNTRQGLRGRCRNQRMSSFSEENPGARSRERNQDLSINRERPVRKVRRKSLCARGVDTCSCRFALSRIRIDSNADLKNGIKPKGNKNNKLLRILYFAVIFNWTGIEKRIISNRIVRCQYWSLLNIFFADNASKKKYGEKKSEGTDYIWQVTLVVLRTHRNGFWRLRWAVTNEIILGRAVE